MTLQAPSNPGSRPLSWQGMLPGLPVVIAISTAISVLVVVMKPREPPLSILLVSNAIGLCAWGLAVLIRLGSAGRVSVPVASALGTVPAVALGLCLGGFLSSGEPLWWLKDPSHNWRELVSNMLLAAAALIYAIRHRKAALYRADLEAQLRQVAEARQGEALARLALLQAQIEPHFLFNTLANVQSMIEREPRTAARMLDHLNHYLRAALGRTRLPTSTCEQEIELIGALLAIAEIRLGQRLRYTLELPAALSRARLPPLLLQPLVENALKHGIEPAVEGGEIQVKCRALEGRLVLRVTDTGLGFQDGAPAGVGLSNIRARLSSLYGDAGQLTLHRNEPRGTVAEIQLPLTVGG